MSVAELCLIIMLMTGSLAILYLSSLNFCSLKKEKNRRQIIYRVGRRKFKTYTEALKYGKPHEIEVLIFEYNAPVNQK